MFSESRGFYISPIGNIDLRADIHGLTSLIFTSNTNSDYENTPCYNRAILDAIRWLDQYFGGYRPKWIPQLNLSGTPFQLSIYKELLKIDYGTILSYSQVAERAALASGRSRFSARSTGQAVGKNPISIIIPCHRVCGANGELVGYAWGLEKKRFLIDLELRT